MSFISPVPANRAKQLIRDIFNYQGNLILDGQKICSIDGYEISIATSTLIRKDAGKESTLYIYELPDLTGLTEYNRTYKYTKEQLPRPDLVVYCIDNTRFLEDLDDLCNMYALSKLFGELVWLNIIFVLNFSDLYTGLLPTVKDPTIQIPFGFERICSMDFHDRILYLEETRKSKRKEWSRILHLFLQTLNISAVFIGQITVLMQSKNLTIDCNFIQTSCQLAIDPRSLDTLNLFFN